MAQPSSADVDDYDYQPGDRLTDSENEDFYTYTDPTPNDPLDLLAYTAAKISRVNAYLSGSEPFGQNWRPYSHPLKISVASYATPSSIVVDPYCGSRYKRSKKRNTSRLRIALQPITVHGSAARRNAVDPGVYLSKGGPYQNTCERGLYNTKQVTYPGEEKALQFRVRWTTDESGNESNYHIPFIKQRSRPRCSKCRRLMKGHGKFCDLAGSQFIDDID